FRSHCPAVHMLRTVGIVTCRYKLENGLGLARSNSRSRREDAGKCRFKSGQRKESKYPSTR
ncbi:MAG: hypothetical protein ACYSUC_10500, partial [Planctomycetota bacterium]